MAQKINIIVLGNGAVGKTSLLKMYSDNSFQESHMATLGLDYVSKAYQPPNSNQEVQVKIWDTAGQERFRTLTQSFYRQAQGIVVAFDVTNEESFRDVKKWMDSIYEHADQNICKVMVGNKIDLENRKISMREAKDVAKSYEMEYFEASAKLNKGVTELFEALMFQVFVKKNGMDVPKKSVQIKRPPVDANQAAKPEKSGCCLLF